MKLALFNDNRLGVVVDDSTIVDVTAALPQHDTGLGAGFWVRLCRDFAELRPAIESAVSTGPRHTLTEVELGAPVLNPTKVIAAASNYTEHIEEMSDKGLPEWMLESDVFLKAPSSIVGQGPITLPALDAEIHYECELAFVIGKGGKDIPVESALEHVFGWTILLDITERGKGDRSRRKSYDGFTPIGPWVVTADEVDSWQDMAIVMRLNDIVRQDVRAGDMLVSVPQIIANASRVMTLNPGDVITTGAPPGVGKIESGDRIDAKISGIGQLLIDVR
ncbi:MAG: fumarylacetoacetate hydrolase family protein [Cryobacterium sp.]|nr:fumarylacetoacetate hydrolase family protein [Cryobacterium sp.]